MSNFNASSSIFIANGNEPNIRFITRGATAILEFDLKDQVYTYENIKQLIFLFKQNKNIYKYEMFKTVGGVTTIDSHFKYNNTTKVITFMWTPAETNAFSVTTEMNPMQAEIVTEIKPDTTTARPETTLITPQAPVAVLDSIYHEVFPTA